MRLGNNLYNNLSDRLFFLKQIEKIYSYRCREEIWEKLDSQVYYLIGYEIVIFTEKN